MNNYPKFKTLDEAISGDRRNSKEFIASSNSSRNNQSVVHNEFYQNVPQSAKQNELFNHSRNITQNTPLNTQKKEEHSSDSDIPSNEIIPWKVAKAIPGSIGSVDRIAKKLGVDRVKLRKFISENQTLMDALEDERMAAREQILEQTYEDAMAGSPQARQDFFKMTGGTFDKKESNDTANQDKVVIMMNEPSNTFKMKTEDGGLVEVDRDYNIISNSDSSGHSDD